jgi:cation diffusion facilitator family transporter
MSTKKQELQLLQLTTLVCLGFGVLGLVASFWAGSNSLLLDGLYSLIQSLFIIGSGKVVLLLFKKDDERFPFGYGSFEPFFLVLRSVVLLTMIMTIGFSATKSLASGGYAISVPIALPVSVLSMVVCFLIWMLLRKKAKELSSPLLRAESKAWMLDTLLSLASVLAILFVLLLSRLGLTSVSSYIDPALTLLFALFLSPSLVKDIMQYSSELLGAAPSDQVQQALEKIVNRFVRSHHFISAEVFASKRGRSLQVVIYIYLGEERPLLELDAIRLEMTKALVSYCTWCDADIIFTVDDRWMDASSLLSIQKA